MTENFLKSIVNHLKNYICVIAEDDEVVYCNEGFCRHFKVDDYEGVLWDEMPLLYKELSLYREHKRAHKRTSRIVDTGNGHYIAVKLTKVIDEKNQFEYTLEEFFWIKEKDYELQLGNKAVTQNSSVDDIVISDKAMMYISRTISRIAYFDSTVLIQGESGTGKTALARFIHNKSNRADKPFVTINCGAIPANLIESELFGYASGAFTSASKKGKAGQVELANGGTLFLDEIALLPYNLQSKFLQLIQEKTYTPVGALESKTVDVRIISATNEDLKQFIRDKKFREDLYYRLRVIELFVPPLREREDAIEKLVQTFLDKYNEKFGKNKSITSAAISAFKSYNWPGNIRELQYIMERVIITSESDVITTNDIPPLKDESHENGGNEAIIVSDIQNFDEATMEFERKILARAYRELGSSYRVAETLGMTQSKVSRLLRKHGISNKK